MSLLTVTINDASPSFDKRNGECAYIVRALQLAGHAIQAAGGTQTSGNIVIEFGQVIGSWVYTPAAAS